MSQDEGGVQGRFYRPGMLGGFSFFPPVIKALLIINVVVWVLFDLFLPLFTYRGVPIFSLFSEYLALWPLGANFWPWQLVTYMFMHGGFGHLFFNMFALWMFGIELEHIWGSRKFLLFYLVCGIGAGLTNLLVAPLVGQASPTVGASGAVFGILIAFGMLFPNRPIYIWFLLPIRAKYLIAGYIGLELFYGITGTTDGIAHFAHLGGAAVGFLFILVENRLIPGRRWLEVLSFSRPKQHSSVGPQERTEVKDARFYDIRTGEPLDDGTEVTQQMVDDILDKISREGYQNLTEKEKQVLNEASKRIH